MSNTILIKRSNTPGAVPSAGNISLGELAINYADGNLFYKDATNSVKVIASNQFLSVIGNITGANVNTGGLSLSGNVLSALNSTSTITTTANIAAGNLLATGLSLSGNVLSIINSTSNINTTANIAASNLLATGLSLSGNVLSALNSTSNITTTGNVSANYLLGNISQATGYSASKIYNGVSEANIGAANANLTVSINSTSNVAVFATTGMYVTGLVSVTGNVISGNVNTNNISVTGDITGAGGTKSIDNIKIGFNTAASGAFTDITSTGIVSATGNVNGGNLISAALVQGVTVSASGNVVGGNVTTAVLITATVNITGGNVLTAGLISATGNITGGNINGTSLTGSVLSVSGNITGGNVNTSRIVGTNTTISSTGNITLAATSNIILGSSGNVVINNVANPVQDADAANKAYVDSVAQGLDVKASVTLATSAALPSYTYNNGSSGIGATLTGTANGALSINSTSTTANARVLIKDEVGTFVNNSTPSAAFNGIYIVTQTGSPTTPYILTRSTDFDSGSPSGEIPGAFTFVEYGSTLADTGWVCNTDAPITVGSTSITFVQFSGAGSYTAGSGLSLTGTQFNVLTDGNANPTTAINGSNQLVIPAGAALTTPNIGAATGTSLSVTGNVTSGNVNTTLVAATTLSATANVVGGNVSTGGLVTATGNITGGNINTGGLVTATGNVTGGNLRTAGSISAAGNITGGNISGTSITGSVVSVTGNVNAAGLVLPSLTGNIVAYRGEFFGNVDIYGNLNATVGLVYANSGIFYGNTSTGNSAAFAGVPGFTSLGSNIVMQFAGNVNSYSQLNFENINSGTQASTDFVLTANNGTDSTYFADFGIAGSGWDGTQENSLGNAVFANDTYLYSHDGNLVLAAAVAGDTVKIVAGGSDNTFKVAEFANTGATITGVASVTGNITGGNIATAGLATVTGNITGGNINTGGLVSATGNVTGGNINTGGLASVAGNIIGGNITTAGTANISTLTVTTGANITASTAATSTSSGALIITGGLGVGGNIYGGALYDNGTAVLTINSTVDGGTY